MRRVLEGVDRVRVRHLLFVVHAPLPDIAAEFRVSKRSVERWRRHFMAHGDAYVPPSMVLGRPRLLSAAQTDVSIFARIMVKQR
jgi:transposase